MGRALFCSVILWSNLLQDLMLVLKISYLFFCMSKYVDVEYLVLFGEPSANCLEM